MQMPWTKQRWEKRVKEEAEKLNDLLVEELHEHYGIQEEAARFLVLRYGVSRAAIEQQAVIKLKEHTVANIAAYVLHKSDYFD